MQGNGNAETDSCLESHTADWQERWELEAYY